ncbi:MAG: hypothetical protein GXX84_16320 [Acidobacteria bacterium]|nr:hypothetical protein [Acidobacteriota bacterium]
MPERYRINVVPAPGRFHRIGKFGAIDWREDCSRCAECVKLRCCFDVHRHETVHNRDSLASVHTLYECKACFSCVQGCTKGLLALSVNPEFLEMGDDCWRPDVIFTTWVQADTGKIPVSGAGYRGAFHGPGFDSIWTDMSEIVRPTRDGIHGREYISTSVDIGPKPMRLTFSPDGEILSGALNLLEVQMPVILDAPAWPISETALARARAGAAGELKTIAAMSAREAATVSPELLHCVAPIFSSYDIRHRPDLIESVRKMAFLIDSPDILESAEAILQVKPEAIISVRINLEPGSVERILELSRRGLKVFHLCADRHGRERGEAGKPGRHIKDALRAIHGRIVDERMRDEITLIVSGGIALAEHMAKAIICGADLVAVDTALLVALGCRVCRNSHAFYPEVQQEGSPHGACPAGIESVDSAYAARRMVNLMGAWHNQLIEVLGAMGIREVRRLRGETGRAIFMEEIEQEAFGDLLLVSDERATV